MSFEKKADIELLGQIFSETEYSELWTNLIKFFQLVRHII